MRNMYRVLGIAGGLVVALCGCDAPPSHDYIKEAIHDTFEAGKSAGKLEAAMDRLQENIQTVNAERVARNGASSTDIATDTQYGHLLPPPTKDSPKWVDAITSAGIALEGATADTPETTFVIGPTVTQDETWTINTDADSRSAISLKGPSTLTFYFGDKQCGQLKCDGQTISFTGDMDKSAQEFVDMVNKLFEWQRTDGK